VSSIWPRLTLTSEDDTFSPEVNWLQVKVDPTSGEFVPPGGEVSIVEGGRLQDGLEAGAALTERRKATLILSNLSGDYTALWANLRMRAQIEVEGEPVSVVYTDRVTRETPENADDKMTWGGAGTLGRLDVPLSDAPIGDGLIHTEFAEDLFKYCGLAEADYLIDEDPEAYVLPESLGNEPPLFQARDGRLVREMFDYICKTWTGWDVWEEQDGRLHYGQRDTDGEAALTLVLSGVAGAGELKCYSLRKSRLEEDFYNVIAVVGRDPAGVPIIGYYYNAASVSDQADPNYLGMEKLLLVVDSNLTTKEVVEQALELLIERYGDPLEEAEAETDWSTDLDVGDLVSLEGDGDYIEVEGVPTWVLYRWQVQDLGKAWRSDGRMTLKLKKLWELLAPTA